MLRFHSPTIAAIALGSSALLHAGDAPAPSIEDRLQALDQEIKILKRKGEIAAEEAAAKAVTAKDAPKLTANAKDGFSLSSGDGAYKVKLGGYAQLEGRYYLHDENVPQTNTFFTRRVRPYLQGTLAKYFDYQLVLDASAASVALLDAHVTANIDPAFRIQAGRYKVPLGLEFILSDPVTPFIERAFPTQLAQGRDAGVQVLGDLGGGLLTYQLGVYNGTTDNANRDPDTSDDKDVVARLYAAPFKETGRAALEGLNLGVAVSFGQDDPARAALATNPGGGNLGTAATNLPTYLSPGGNQFFGYINAAGIVVGDGDHLRISPQLYYTWGPWDVLGEYIVSKQDVRVVVAATDTPVAGIAGERRSVTNKAWQIETGYVLTGEKASFKGVVPDDGGVGSGGWGAWQVVFRVSALEVDDSAFNDTLGNAVADRRFSAKSALDLGVGLNWWLNRNLRLVFNYDRTTFEWGGGGTNVAPEDKDAEHVIRSRIQLSF